MYLLPFLVPFVVAAQEPDAPPEEPAPPAQVSKVPA